MESNTSGRRCSPTELPKSAKKLSWGAFWGCFVWGIFNNTWRSFFVFIIPGVMNIILLFKGRQWAWENRKWDNEEQFDKSQRLWGITSFIAFSAPLLIIIINSIIVFFLIKPTTPQNSNTFSKTSETQQDSSTVKIVDNEILVAKFIYKNIKPVTVIVDLNEIDGKNILKVSIAVIPLKKDVSSFNATYDKQESKLQLYLINYLSNLAIKDLKSDKIINKIEIDYFNYLSKLIPETTTNISKVHIFEFIRS